MEQAKGIDVIKEGIRKLKVLLKHGYFVEWSVMIYS